MTQGSDYSAITRIEDSYCIGDVLIASTAVIGNGVMLRADPGCSITIREGACLGADVLIHASEGSIEIHQDVCLATGVLIFGSGRLGKQVCVGANTTLINPHFSDCTIVSSGSLWGDESRPALSDTPPSNHQKDFEDAADTDAVEESNIEGADIGSSEARANQHVSESNVTDTATHSSTSVVIGRQQFEMMVAKMFPDRDAFQQSQT